MKQQLDAQRKIQRESDSRQRDISAAAAAVIPTHGKENVPQKKSREASMRLVTQWR